MSKWTFLPCEQGSDIGAMPILVDINAGRMSENEGQAKLVEEGYQHVVNARLACLRKPKRGVDSLMISDRPLTTSYDGGSLLWSLLKSELEEDEYGFKRYIVGLDLTSKLGGPVSCPVMSMMIIQIVGLFPHRECNFAALAVALMVSEVDAESKRSTSWSFCTPMGVATIAPVAELAATRWPYHLTFAFSKAVVAALSTGKCTAIHIEVTDVELMRNPRTASGKPRSVTFSHTCVMTVSSAGVYVLQGFGPRGYTLLQWIQEHDSQYPLSFNAGSDWVVKFEEFTGELGGAWTPQVNEAYTYCFGVDLVAVGRMRVGSQLDAHVVVKTLVFDADTVQRNLSLLPEKDVIIHTCNDGIIAKSKAPIPGYKPDGGFPQYYVPLILRCACCGAKSHQGNQACSRCRRVDYCGQDCQTKDWFARHKKVCKRLAAPNSS